MFFIYASLHILLPSEFVASPQPMNVSLGDIAVFKCTANAAIFVWQANGTNIDQKLRNKGFNDTVPPELLPTAPNLRSSQLSVLGSVDSNRTYIACLAFPWTTGTELNITYNTSEPVLLLVQGEELVSDTPLVIKSLVVNSPQQVNWLQFITSM